MFKRLIIWSIAIVALTVLIFAYIPSFIADSLYKNVDDITDGEMPRTVTSFQSGPEVVSTVGGRGEGLNCSIPAVANVLFDGSYQHGKNAEGKPADKRHLVLQRFRQACVLHDLCYRHGLATYGYNQNDCDRVLQNEAFRLCLYIRNGDKESTASRCQIDSKLILAGVSIGGYESYHAWDKSTYFEFESDPSRSNGFTASRVVDHPFKPIDPGKYRNESDQIILSFDNIRSNLTVTCTTCGNTPVFGWTNNPDDVSPELRSAGITRLPEALLKRGEQKLSETMPIWLPPRRRHAAPHLLVDGAGKNHLIWMSRNNPQDTISCIVLADAARLLTNTLPRRDLCADGARSSLTMVEVDMFATSPLPMELPGAPDHILTTSISAQKDSDRSLYFCSRSASRTIDRSNGSNDDRAKCLIFPNGELKYGAGLGAFQNFTVVRAGQQIYFARDIEQRADSLPERLWQRAFGNTYSPGGALLVVNVQPPTVAKGPAAPNLDKIIRFNVDDRFDPMMPVSRRKDDLRFLSLEAPKPGFLSRILGLETNKPNVHVRMIDFDKDAGAVSRVRLSMNGDDVVLHGSWALRPMLVLETKEAKPKTKLVFSRGEVATDPSKRVELSSNSEALTLETIVFERDAAAGADTPFVKTGGATCTVSYTFKVDTDYPCTRAFDPKRPMRPSPATRMQASQLLVGHFAGRDGHGIAFPDFCRKDAPIILKPQGGTFAPAVESVADRNPKRKVTCTPINATADVSQPIKHKASASGLSGG